jgi:ketosteroid isomerase-like protein
MNRVEVLEFSEKLLSAWNSQDIDSVLTCYREDCIYRDPNTQGPVKGHNSLRKYLTKLFQQWKMHWSLREFFLFNHEKGGAFLWHAKFTPSTGGKTIEVDGMDLILVRGDRMCRNDVYFDRMAIFNETK